MTEDKDKKRAVRARMEATGERYTEALAAIEGGPPPPSSPVPPEGAVRFGFPADHESAAGGPLGPSLGAVDVNDRQVVVWLRWPNPTTSFVRAPTFDLVASREVIAGARRLPDMTTNRPTIGVHGRRGRWLVNSVPTGLVEVTFAPGVRASISTTTTDMPVPAWVRLLVRLATGNGSPRVDRLTVSVSDPDGLIAALT